jgi:DNA polymerase III epsilon subunit-like protein
MVIIGIDIETTDGSHNICEFATVGLEPEIGADIFSVTSLVDPWPVKWTYFAMRVHAISPAMVRGKRNITEVWNSFKKVL